MAATASTGPSSKQTVRIQKDLKALEKDPLPFVRDLQASVENGVNQLSGILTGPEGSNYAGNEYRFLMIFPPQYPFRIPEFYFTSTISHPNVDEKTGTTCNAQLFSEWAPNVTLSHVFTQMHQLLANPNYDTPLEAGS